MLLRRYVDWCTRRRFILSSFFAAARLMTWVLRAAVCVFSELSVDIDGRSVPVARASRSCVQLPAQTSKLVTRMDYSRSCIPRDFHLTCAEETLLVVQGKRSEEHTSELQSL